MFKTLVLGIDGLWLDLVIKYVKEGKIPNIAKLVNRGVSGEMLPLPPCDTPTNWVCLSTGATPGTHGAIGFNVHLPGEPVDSVHVPDTNLITAEFVWNVAEREGKKCILINWPFSWPPTIKDGIVIAGTGPGDPRWRIEYGCIYTTDPLDRREIKVEVKLAEDWKNLPKSHSPPLEVVIPLKTRASAFVWTESGWESTKTEVEETIPMSEKLTEEESEIKVEETKECYYAIVVDSKGEGYDTVIVTKEKDASDKMTKLSLGSWSDWIFDEFRFKIVAKYHGVKIEESLREGPLKGAFKFKLVELSEDGKRLTLYRTAIFRTDGWVSPEGLAEDIVRNVGPYCEGLELIPLITITRKDFTTYFELLKMQMDWFIRALKYFSERYDWDLLMMQLHIFDALNHGLLRYLYEEGPEYSQEMAEKVWKIYEETIKILDHMVGEVLKIIPKDVIFFLISDHGAIPTTKLAWPGIALMKKGLLSLVSDEDGKVKVDWKNTKAFPWVMDVWVNLKGKFPHGIVDESEYDDVVKEIIDALYSMKDPENGMRIISLALPKKDAEILGLKGERAADVYYFFNPPYTDTDVHRHKIFEIPMEKIEELYEVRTCKTKAAHDHFLPTTKVGVFSNRALLIVYNEDSIRQGVRVEKTFYTTDLVPTICHILKIPFPKQCEGKIMFDIFKSF
ncbi:MAG: alkaline phosphatase family protein [Candidatus Odinarchaeota archaeon]|nr:alkaline phosphatase family protein [Candidatus Odinarchaeota archaeon]